MTVAIFDVTIPSSAQSLILNLTSLVFLDLGSWLSAWREICLRRRHKRYCLGLQDFTLNPHLIYQIFLLMVFFLLLKSFLPLGCSSVSESGWPRPPVVDIFTSIINVFNFQCLCICLCMCARLCFFLFVRYWLPFALFNCQKGLKSLMLL